jgi:hypothetical protein
MKPKFRMEILNRVGNWEPVGPSRGEPYEYDTRDEAERMLRFCYPDQVRINLGTVRVVEVTP